MDYLENFKIRCTEDEAENVAGQVPADAIKTAYECYYNAYKNTNEDYDALSKCYLALANVYVLGFLSGSRAVRERKKAAHGNGRPKLDI